MSFTSNDLLALLEQTLKAEIARSESEIESVTFDGDHRSSEIFVSTKDGKNYIVMVLLDRDSEE